MANHASHAALPYPIKNARYTVLVPYLDADGDPTDPTTPDTEVSKDDGAAADTAEEAASPKNSVAMITLTGAETDCSALSLAAKAASGPKTTLMTLSPMVLASVGTGTLSAGSAGGGTLGTLLGYDVTGCFIKTTGGTGGGGTGGANNQARKIITYNTSSGAFTVAPNWETTPDNTTTYDVLLPDGVTLGMLKALNPTTAGRTILIGTAGQADANVTQYGGSNGTFAGGRPEVNASHAAGTAWNSGAIGAATLANDTITAAKIASDAITAAKIASDAITAAKIAADAFTAAKFAADVTTELQSGLATAAALATVAGYVDTEIASIISSLATIAGYLDTEIAAIKAKTDNLPSDPADQSAVEAAITAAQTAIIDDAAQLRDFGIMQVTTIASLTSQTVFRLTDASPDDDAYNGAELMFTDQTTEEQKSVAVAADYDGSDKEITLQEAPVFTIAVGDHVTIKMPPVGVFKRRVDGTVTFEQSVRLQNSAAGAKLSGAATTTVSIRDLADSKDRMVATVDASGNRSAITRDLT